MIKWTTESLKAARDTLSKHGSLQSALPEVAKVTGFHVTSSSLRKAFETNGFLSPSNYLDATKRDLIAEREAAEERAQLESAKRQLVDEVRELRARQKFLDKVGASKRPPKLVPREKGGVREMTAVALASDWHVEETVDPETVAGLNEYDLDIASDRVERFFKAIAWHVEHQRASGQIKIRDLILWLGGDLITGYIHEELMETNGLSPTETVLWLLPRLHGGFNMLLDQLNLEKLVIPCSFGNHGRTGQKMKVSTAYANSFEWLMYQVLAQRFETDKRVEFHVTNSAHQFAEAYDFKLHFHHGHELQFQGGVGGLTVPLNKAVSAWNQSFGKQDCHFIGHWHTLLDLGHAVINGSLIGYGAFTLKIRANYEVPQQSLSFIDSKRGRTMSSHLWVADRPEKKR